MKIVKNKKEIREKYALDLHHENIVRTIKIFNSEIDTYAMILMEYIPNCVQLHNLLEDFDIDIDGRMKKFSIDICKGLAHCHRNKILHLDLKPQNILVCNNGCKICDFGNSIHEDHIGGNFKHHVCTRNNDMSD